MSIRKTRLELTWIGKDERPKLEPRILIEDPLRSHHAAARGGNDIFGNMLIHLVDSHPPPYTGATLIWLFFPLVSMLVAFTYGILKIPSLVNSIFTGRAGESALPHL